MIGFPKQGHIYSDAYLDYRRSRGCFFCSASAPSEPHHHPPKGMGGGLVDDLKTVSVCRECHRRAHGDRIQVASGLRLPYTKDQVTAAVDASLRQFFYEAPQEIVGAVIADLYAWRAKRGL